MRDPTPLILFSGMGADERVFAPQLHAFPQLVVPKWIPPEPRDSLAGYARRFAAAINPGRPCFIGGASFGGMVAIEAARHLDAKACFLIGSVRSPAELPTRLRVLRGLTPAVPFPLLTRLTGSAVKHFGDLSSPATRGFLEQAAGTDANFLRFATRAVLTWESTRPAPPGVPVFQIHGERDPILPVRLTRPDEIVPGGGHVLTLSHPDAVNAFLREHITRLGG